MFCDYVSIHSQEEMAPGIYRMVLEAPEAAAAAAPGQFVNLYVNNPSMLLPRPISICEADPETGLLTLIYAVVGHGTDELAGYTAGTRLRLMGPLGNGTRRTGVGAGDSAGRRRTGNSAHALSRQKAA